MEHHVALVTLFEILEVAGRAELKFDLVQELERQRQILLSFRNNPEISEQALSGALYEIEQASALLLAMQGKIGHYLRENEWLMAIKNRAAIPGGVCEFDLPGYHYWRHREPALRQQDIENWIAPMLPIRAGLAIVLRLLRASGRAEAAGGAARHLPADAGRPQRATDPAQDRLPRANPACRKSPPASSPSTSASCVPTWTSGRARSIPR
jgi:cell division protein ZapD